MILNVPATPDPRGIFAPDAAGRLAADHCLDAFRPIDRVIGPASVADCLLTPLAAAIPNYDVRADIAVRGSFKGGDWTASSGHICGRFMAPLFGIPPTERAVYIRFGCFQRWNAERVSETILLLDLPSLMIHAGAWPLAAPLGPDLMAPPPLGHAGVWPEGDGTASLAIVENMIGGLMKFDGSLKTMNMRDFFAEDFWWFGPAPVGSFRGFADYERGHATPFLTAFPDRVGGNHRARFGDGHFVASTGWPSITATHNGNGWLGLAATDRAITMRVMDFWHANNGLLIENWVMIDIPDLMKQLGIDLFAALNDRS
jgi:SnoaL-like domain/SnoaL-like polyketide cyclase